MSIPARIVADLPFIVAALFLAAAMAAVFWRSRKDRQHRYRLEELGDLTRNDIDPHWAAIKDTLPGLGRDVGDLPSSHDPCITRYPRTPRQGERP